MCEVTISEYDKMIFHLIHKYKLSYDFDEYYQLALIKAWELEQIYDAKKTPNKNQYMFTKLNFFFIDEIRKLAKRTDRFVVTDDEFMKQNMTVTDDYDTLILNEIQPMLNTKEYNYLTLMLEGYKMKEIAGKMNVSVSMVKKYKLSVKQKLHGHFYSY